MLKTSTLLALVITALANFLCALPAHAQRVFVSGSGSDANPCTFTQPCRSFQQAFDTAPDNGEIDVLDPAGYGPLTITHGISIQAHGFGGITQTSSSANAITITSTFTANNGDISLNGLLMDGAGTGQYGILIEAGASIQILNCVVRHFADGIEYEPPNSSSNFLVSNTIASDNTHAGIYIQAANSATGATLSEIAANNNGLGVIVQNGSVTVKDSVLSDNGGFGLATLGSDATIWLANSVISGNGTGVALLTGTVNSYGDNDINSNGTDLNTTSGTFATVSTE